MEYRQLGKSKFKVSVVGVGCEYLKKVPTEEVSRIFSFALQRGVNYFDLVWSFSNIIDGLRDALQKQPTEVVSALHLGSCVINGEYERSRNPEECEKHLRKQLDRLSMDSAPIVNIHYVPNLKVWREINRKGIVALAAKLKERGLAEAISVSTHEPEVVKLAAESGLIDCVMHQVNVANHMYTPRNEALSLCSKLGVGVVAMKPFAGGELLKAGQRVKIAAYKTGWKSITVNVPEDSTSTRLLSYALNQPGVCTAVTGVSSLGELAMNISCLSASSEERSFSKIVESFQKLS